MKPRYPNPLLLRTERGGRRINWDAAQYRSTGRRKPRMLLADQFTTNADSSTAFNSLNQLGDTVSVKGLQRRFYREELNEQGEDDD